MSYNSEYEENFWSEIFGCVKYLKLPYETVMSMPINLRKFWIKKHNQDEEKRDKEHENRLKNKNGKTVNTMAINTYAKLEQEKLRNEAK